MFADIDKDAGGTVDKTEMALYIMKLIKNKNKKASRSDYLIKLNEMKRFIDSKVQNAESQLRSYYGLDDTDISSDHPADERAAKDLYNQIQKEIIMH